MILLKKKLLFKTLPLKTLIKVKILSYQMHIFNYLFILFWVIIENIENILKFSYCI